MSMNRAVAIYLGGGLLAAASPLAGQAPAAPAAPAPPAVRSPSDAIAASTAADWQDIDPADILLFEFEGGRSVVIQLAPQFAPEHIANIKQIVRSGHWANATIYRVADNWVTQWGAGEDDQEKSPPLPKGVKEQPAEEYSRTSE